MSFMAKIYQRSPAWMQALAMNAYAFQLHRQRYGKPFFTALEELARTEAYSEELIRDYQLERIRALLRHAYDTVPFYRRLYDKYGVRPEDVNTLNDIQRLPIVSREEVREAGNELLSTKVAKRDVIYGRTSGTTGSPLAVAWDRRTCTYTNAVDWRQKRWAGIEYGERIALLLGRMVVAPTRTRPPFWQEDKLHNMLWMSSFHLGERFLPFYVDKLRRYKPAAIEGYPSTLYVLAKYLQSTNETLPVKAAFSSSETLLPFQRELIEERFCTVLYDFYGMAERVAFATQCAEAGEYHLNFEYAFNEVVDAEGGAVEEGQEGYLVGTSLLNFAMPLIRYRTSDVTAIATSRCECGRSMPRLRKVATKDEDMVVTPDGRCVASSALTHPFKALAAVRESQIVQESVGVLRVLIVRGSDYSDRDSERLIEGLRERLGPEMQIHIEFVENIPRTASGKLRWVVSMVSPAFNGKAFAAG